MCPWSFSHPLLLCFLTYHESADSCFPKSMGTGLSSAHCHSPPPSHSIYALESAEFSGASTRKEKGA